MQENPYAPPQHASEAVDFRHRVRWIPYNLSWGVFLLVVVICLILEAIAPEMVLLALFTGIIVFLLTRGFESSARRTVLKHPPQWEGRRAIWAGMTLNLDGLGYGLLFLTTRELVFLPSGKTRDGLRREAVVMPGADLPPLKFELQRLSLRTGPPRRFWVTREKEWMRAIARLQEMTGGAPV